MLHQLYLFEQFRQINTNPLLAEFEFLNNEGQYRFRLFDEFFVLHFPSGKFFCGDYEFLNEQSENHYLSQFGNGKVLKWMQEVIKNGLFCEESSSPC